MADVKAVSSRPAVPGTMAHFDRIHTRTSTYTPPKPAPGELVIICTWLGAAPKHISKYVEMYRDIAPGARILLIESAVPILVSSYAYQRRMIQPAADFVLEVLAETSFGEAEKTRPAPRILLHTFSNGGTNTATQLLLVLAQRSGAPLPLAGILMDSCPAKGTYSKSVDAMVLSLPKDALTQLLGALVVRGLLVVLYAWIACGNENPASLMRRTLLSEQAVAPAADSSYKGHACYLYSRADRMCHWQDVADHARDARARGWYVEQLEFDGTAHCAHLQGVGNAQRYRAAAHGAWDGGEQRERHGVAAAEAATAAGEEKAEKKTKEKKSKGIERSNSHSRPSIKL